MRVTCQYRLSCERLVNMTIILPPAMACDLGSELFIAARVIGSTLSSMVEQVAISQGVCIYMYM